MASGEKSVRTRNNHIRNVLHTIHDLTCTLEKLEIVHRRRLVDGRFENHLFIGGQYSELAGETPCIGRVRVLLRTRQKYLTQYRYSWSGHLLAGKRVTIYRAVAV